MGPVALMLDGPPVYIAQRTAFGFLMVVVSQLLRRYDPRRVILMSIACGLLLSLYAALALEGVHALLAIYYGIGYIFFSSIFLLFRYIVLFFVILLLILVALPMLAPDVSIDQVIAGPMSFFLLLLVLAFLVTNYRDSLAALQRNLVDDSENRYRIISELVSDFAFSARITPAGRVEIEWITDSFTRITGYSIEEACCPAIVEINDSPDGWHNVLRDIQQQVLSGRVGQRDYRLTTKNGMEHWLNLRWYPIHASLEQGALARFYAVARDITDQIMMEVALRRSENLTRSFIEQSNDGIVLVDGDDRVIEWNSAQTGITGITRDVAVNQSFTELFTRIYDGSNQREYAVGVIADFQRALRGQQVTWFGEPVEYMIRHADGSRRVVLAVTFPVDTNEGRMIGSIIRDITHRKRAQQREFDISLEKERVQLLSTFIQNAAHEFRTPLATINTSAYLMARLDDPAERSEKAELIRSQIHRTNNLVDMMLKITYLETITPALTRLQVAEVLREFCEQSDTIQGYATIRCQIDSELPDIKGDRLMLREALEPLIENARRYSPPGSTIALRAQTRDRYVVIAIEDQGPGIQPEVLPYIFDMFWRDDEARSTPGLGLGLPLARKIVQLHGGDIEVISELDKGCTFCVLLPSQQVS
ncbi:MAG: PAS domain-containing sensor histidine kinase [Chloroflexota bacterium]